MSTIKIALLLANILVILCTSSANLLNIVPQQVPGLFFLGDSLLDNGNNNALNTTARANYFPYGVDFPGGPTGRFSNGRNMADVTAKLLGFDHYIKPFTTAINKDLFKGVNYASGGSGIRDETGSQLGKVISLNEQLKNHQSTVDRLAYMLGSQEAALKYISKCMYIIWTGSNDYINNYLMPQSYNTSAQYNPQEYATVLAQQYSEKLRTLYKIGARKVAIFGLARIGCMPFEMASFGTNGKCVEKVNDDVRMFNDQVVSLVDSLNHDLRDAKFTYINVTNIQSGKAPSIIDTTGPCCQVSTTVAKGQCTPNLTPCNDRILHEFFDQYHPSDVSAAYGATRAYINVTSRDAHPYDLLRLALHI